MAQLKRYNGTSWENVGGSVAPKTSQTTSDTDTYSCNYVDNNLTNIKSAIDYKNPDYMGDVVVESIRTKNIFSNYSIIFGWLDNNTISVSSASNERLAFIPCKANTTYTVSRGTITSRFRVGDYTTIPIMTSSSVTYTPGGWVKNESASSITYTTSSSAKYLIVEYADYNYDTETDIQNVLNSLQVEEGSTATTYMPSQALGSTKWNLIAEVSGETVVNLPSSWNEIMIVSWRNNNNWNGMTMVIPYGAPSGINYRLSYYGSATDNVNVGYLYSTSNTIKLGFYNINGTSYNSEGKTQVYYR